MESIGKTLREYREEKGISLDAIADDIKAKPHIIEAIEEDKILDIVAHTYAKGYIRAYCGVIEVDSEPIIAQFDKEYVSPTIKEMAPPIDILQQRTRADEVNWFKISGVVIGILVVVYLVFRYWEFWEVEEKLTTPTTEQPVIKTETTVAEPIPATPTSEELAMWVEAKDDVNITRISRDGIFIGDERVSKGGKSGTTSGKEKVVFEIDNGAAATVKSPTGGLEKLPKGKIRVTLTRSGLNWESLEEKTAGSDTSSDTK